jgi:hypothetical protein
LERALNNNQQQPQQQQRLESSSEISSSPAASGSGSGIVMVRHRGIPGWTANAMSQDLDGPNTGLRSALQALSTMPIPGVDNDDDAAGDAGISLVIILAGTNDIGYGFDQSDIAQAIIALHRTCFENNVPRTLAIAIPPSAYQSINAQAATLVQGINQELQDYCCRSQSQEVGQQQQQRKQRASTTTYMSFPFDYNSTSRDHWSADGLHFSARGYQTLGEKLAPIVSAILQELEQEEEQS